MRWRFSLLLVAYCIGAGLSDAAGESWLIYLIGCLVQVIAISMFLHLFYLDGYRDGVRSVPLDGTGLASGDDRAFDAGHRWNADLGAWERVDHG